MIQLPILSTFRMVPWLVIVFELVLHAPSLLRAAEPSELWVDQRAGSSPHTGSESQPFLSISDATAVAKPGTTIIVRAGIYRESINLPSGTAEAPITLKAQDGHRVEICGAEPIQSWTPREAGVFESELDFATDRLLCGGRSMELSSEPNVGWWTIDDASPGALKSRQIPFAKTDDPFAGSEIFAWVKDGNVNVKAIIEGQDPATQTLQYVTENKTNQIQKGDRFRLQNARQWIDLPGEYAIRQREEGATIWAMPPRDRDLRDVEAVKRQDGITVGSHTRLSGLIVSGQGRYGILASKAQAVQIDRCFVSGCATAGIWLIASTDSNVTHCTIMDNQMGIGLHSCVQCGVASNDVFENRVDGIRVVWGSRSIEVKGNYVHHHLTWGHPDAIQLFRDVVDVAIRGNVVLANGQSMHIQQATDVVIEGNAVIGSVANAITFGRSKDATVTLAGNTIAYTGYQTLNMNASNLRIANNILMTGHGKSILSVAGPYKGESNAFWHSKLGGGTMFGSYSKKILRGFNAYQASSGTESESRYVNPSFVTQPTAIDAIDSRESQLDRLAMRSHQGLFRDNDVVEFNFDGVSRRITSVTPTHLEIEPPLSRLPRAGILVNWGTSRPEKLDFRSKEPAGAKLNIDQFQRRDFDGDGAIDVLEWSDRAKE
jgi:parallel beta-helix repeat protein